MTETAACYHCKAPLSGTSLTAPLGNQEHVVCSTVCRDTVRWINDRGLADYYRLRSQPAAKPSSTPTDDIAAWQDPRLAQQVVRPLSRKRGEVCVLVDGIRCNGCAWLVERTLLGLAGVESVQVNALTRRARIIFEPNRTSLSALLDALAQAGFQPRPLDAQSLGDARRQEARQFLKYLLVAGFGMMQAMMFALVLYLGPAHEVQGATLSLFRWLGFLVATPVVLYAARPFFAGAWRALRARYLNMDVPIALAIGLVYVASLYQSVTEGTEVYFDSVTMLVFFLLIGRYLEMRARHRAVDSTDALAQAKPQWAERLNERDETERIPLSDLAPGDRVLVRDGGALPADGTLISETASVDESLLSGESRPCRKQSGEALVAGSVAQGQPLTLRVTHCGEQTFLATLAALATRAQTQRPRLAHAGEKVAARFVLTVLGLTLLTALTWALLDPSKVLDASLAVLVVSCPCAFALAVPAAITRSLAVLARRGVLVLRPDALETLTQADYAVFDKTGTLTQPSLSLREVTPELSASEAFQLAASLSNSSQHPLSQAFADANHQPLLPTAQVQVLPALGLTGMVNGRALRLGREDFASAANEEEDSEGDVVLADETGVLARFQVRERLRTDARAAVSLLRQEKLCTEILSGDAAPRVKQVASELGLTQWQSRCLPAEKLDYISALQQKGHRLLAVGDGSNDAPILAGADVSVALSSGTDLAQAQADIVLCSGRLSAVAEARALARQTLRVLKQNQRWAIAYNFIAMPIAAMGYVTPWLAALGMSFSSLVVVLNALRIHYDDRKASAEIDVKPDLEQLAPTGASQ